MEPGRRARPMTLAVDVRGTIDLAIIAKYSATEFVNASNVNATAHHCPAILVEDGRVKLFVAIRAGLVSPKLRWTPGILHSSLPLFPLLKVSLGRFQRRSLVFHEWCHSPRVGLRPTPWRIAIDE